MTGAPLLLVTRPEPQAGEWVAQLQQRGCRAQALPLIEVQALPRLPLAPPSPLADPTQPGPTWRAILFVSPSAVAHCPQAWLKAWFNADTPPRAWAPGPGTAKALQQAGLKNQLNPLAINAPLSQASQFDSESLWPQVAEQIHPGDAVLILRGLDASGEPVTDTQGSGREWLAEQIRARQGQVHYQAVYQRKAPSNLPPWVLEQPPRELVWLFSSSQAVQHLQQCAPSPLFWQHHRALATHPRIAQTTTDLGFETVEVVPPQTDAIAQRLQSWVSR